VVYPRRKAIPLICLGLLALIAAAAATPILKLNQAATNHPNPQAIFMLGGGTERESYTARLAQAYPNLPIWVSSGSPQRAKAFAEFGIAPHRMYFDNRATDTVSNFTTTLQPLKAHGIHHVYIVTSDYHMLRATAIATIIFGSHSIAFTPVEVPTEQTVDSIEAIQLVY
jgi:uncharacterized SAM-binding protein YcdF (DUF218 family)